MVKRKWPMPKYGAFTRYCCHCRHWEFIRDVGCAHEGVCRAIVDDPTYQDAYDKPCGLWEGVTDDVR